jgi:hypothetical protein
MKISRWPDHPRNLAWHRDDKKGTHVPLPLDVSQVSDAVVKKVASATRAAADQWWNSAPTEPLHNHIARAAIAALAAALGEVSDG